MRRSTLPCAVFLFAATAGLKAQNYDLQSQGNVIGDLSNAKWRFHTGDDPAWASPDFDDSRWSLLAGDKPWDEQGYRGYSGTAWYRLRVRLPAAHSKFKLAVGKISDSYELFADGRRIGSFGSPSADATPLVSPAALTLFPVIDPSSREIILAIRVWHWPRWAMYAPGGFRNDPFLLGTPSAISDYRSLRLKRAIIERSSAILIGILCCIGGVLTLVLFAKERSSTEYLWFGLSLLLIAFQETGYMLAQFFLKMDVNDADAVFSGIASLLSTCTSVLFFFRFLQKPLSTVAKAYLIAQAPFYVTTALLEQAGKLSISSLNAMSTVNNALVSIIVLHLVFSNIRHSHAARMLALPVTLVNAASLVYGAFWMLYTAGFIRWTIPPLLKDPWLDWQDLSLILFLVIMAYILMERFAETRSQQSRLHAEFEAAQQVQRLLLESSVQSPQLPVEVCYLPANETGGDFFKVFHESGGSLLIVVGDVSGKGMKAAMIVAGIIGALELIATEAASPADVLTRLNEFLVTKSQGGFVTCSCARILLDGTLTIANAGHLPPYLDGEELPVAGSLPLGVATGVEFPQTRCRMEAGSRLAFVTDGVIEATNSSGELFGFERARSISTDAPQSIAEQARAFGQNDDITVLQVTRSAAYAT